MTNGGQQPEQSTSAGAMCKIRPAMGIETSGKYAWRTDLSEVSTNCSMRTRSSTADSVCEFARGMLPVLKRRRTRRCD
jgi:hypothetical protein